MFLTLGQLAPDRIRERLAQGRLNLRIGPLSVKVQSRLPVFSRWLPYLYADYPVADPEGFADFRVRVDRPWGVRRWWRPQVVFRSDTERPFKPLPKSQALPFFEWGLNWCVAQHAHRYLILHAGVVARDERALLLPGVPGAGKSTLCAGLVARGWRLLSDELVLIRPERGDVIPLPRPISLKNASLAVIRSSDPEAPFGPCCHDTLKGSVAHLRPPTESVVRAGEPARVDWVIFPSFQAARGGEEMAGLPVGEVFQGLIGSAFNFPVQGPQGFEVLADIASQCPGYRLEHDDLEQACQAIAVATGTDR